MFCYIAGTEVPGTRKTTSDKKQTAITTATKTKTKTTTEAETETETVAATLTIKTVRTIAIIGRTRTTSGATATNKITEDKSQGLFSFTVPFALCLVQSLNDPNRYMHINNHNKITTKNIRNNSNKQRTKTK